MSKLLFHPHVTLAAVLTTVVAVAAALATLGTPLGGLFGAAAASKIVDVCLIVAGVAGAVAGLGRSPIAAVDNASSVQPKS